MNFDFIRSNKKVLRVFLFNYEKKRGVVFKAGNHFTKFFTHPIGVIYGKEHPD